MKSLLKTTGNEGDFSETENSLKEINNLLDETYV